jgi:hypothetical protein
MFIGVPHYYLGFYNKVNPSIFQNRVNDKDGTHYGNFSVKNIDWNNLDIVKDNLYITSSSNKPTEKSKNKIKLEKDFVDPSGYSSFQIWRGI